MGVGTELSREWRRRRGGARRKRKSAALRTRDPSTGAAARHVQVPVQRDLLQRHGHEVANTDRMSAAIELANLVERSITGPMWHGSALNELLTGVTHEQAAARP